MADAYNGYKRGMVVVAHPDDAEFGFSGTVAKFCQQGIEMFYVLCTDGSKGSSDSKMTPDKLAKIRMKEQRDACDVLGVKDVVFLGYEDAMLVANLDLRRDIAREIRRFKPDVLICQSPLRSFNATNYLGHPDHLAAAEATLSAVFPTARDHLTFPELLKQGFQPHKVREVLVSGGDHSDTWFDVGDSLDTAIAALKKHVSQVGGRDAEVEKRMKEWRADAGQPKNIKYAEGFKSFKLRV
ncbi:MAG: PIG-L family deacetylase [SAR202 cluster bacterium]|nr:PIG-L family deacetylase [SAR202 cluster bacterium]